MSTIENGIETGQLLKIIANQQQQINDLRTLLYKVHDIQELDYYSKYKKSHEHLFSQKCIDEIRAKTIKITNTTFNNIYKNLTTDYLKLGYYGVIKVIARELYDKIHKCSLLFLKKKKIKDDHGDNELISSDNLLYIFDDKIIFDRKGKRLLSIIVDIIFKKYNNRNYEINNLEQHIKENEEGIDYTPYFSLFWYSLEYFKEDLKHKNIKRMKKLIYDKLSNDYNNTSRICSMINKQAFQSSILDLNKLNFMRLELKFYTEAIYDISVIENYFEKRFKNTEKIRSNIILDTF